MQSQPEISPFDLWPTFRESTNALGWLCKEVHPKMLANRLLIASRERHRAEIRRNLPPPCWGQSLQGWVLENAPTSEDLPGKTTRWSTQETALGDHQGCWHYGHCHSTSLDQAQEGTKQPSGIAVQLLALPQLKSQHFFHKPASILGTSSAFIYYN